MRLFQYLHIVALEQQKIYADPQLGNVIFRKRKGIRRVSIRVHPSKGVSVSLPYLVPYTAAQAFFRLKREWVIQTVARQKERYKDVQKADPQQVDAMRRQAKAELPGRLAELAARYGFTYNRVTIKHNSTNWGSCSARNNINLNLNVVRLPKVLQDYVLLHELCHLRHPDHGHGFHLLLEHLLTDNIMLLLNQQTDQDPDHALTMELARKAAASRARYPLDYTITRSIKQCNII